MRFLCCALLGALAATLAGCGKREGAAAEGVRTRSLLVGNAAEPADLDPHLASVLNDQIVVNTLFEGLTVLDERSTRPPAGRRGVVGGFRRRPRLDLPAARRAAVVER